MSIFAGIIERYGDEAVIHGEEDIACRCFIEPILSKNIEKTWSQMSRVGARDGARFYGFFPPEVSMPKKGYVTCGDRQFDILRTESFKVYGKVSHFEALMRIRPEGEHDGD